MRKRLFKIEDFEARRVGVNVVDLYAFKRDRWSSITILLPHRGLVMKTGKPGIIPGDLSVSSSSSHTRTIKRAVRWGRAIVAAAMYLHEARMEARGVSK